MRQYRPEILIAAIATLMMPALAQASGPGHFVQSDFCISFWVDPPLDENADRSYQMIADAHFNVVMGNFGARKPGDVERQLKLCQKHGLKAIVKPGDGSPAGWADGPACLGYLLQDEPKAKDFAALAARVKSIREHRPGKLGYINLYPSHATPKHWGADSYEAYLTQYLDTVRPDVLCFDRYPIMNPDRDERDGYCENLEVIRRHAIERNIPFWNFFNIIPYGNHEDPTEAQVAWQIYTSIAYGAKGVLYFCYWTPRGDEFPRGGAIIAVDGRPTQHYDQARRINARVSRLGPVLMKLTSTGAVRIKPGETADGKLAGSPIRSLTDGDYLLGVFKHADGRQAILLNNYRFAYTAWPTVEFAVDLDRVREVDPDTGEEIAVRDSSPDMPGLQLSIDAGVGRLFLIR